MARVLITGGAGFVGYHLAALLAAKGHDITIADNFSRGKKDGDLEKLLALHNVSLVEGDLTEPSMWDQFQGFEQVYHLASINGTRLFYEMPHEVLRVGLLASINALEWFRAKNGLDGAKILFTSSNEAYGGALEAFKLLPIPTPENVPLVIADPYNPRWSYAGQKLAGELLFIHYASAYGFRMSIVRPHNFYGPRAGWGHVIPETVAKIRARTEPFPLPGANETRSFCYITDAVEAIAMVMASDKTDGGTYHIGSREETTIRELVGEIFDIADWRPAKLEEKESPPGSVSRRLADVSKIQRDTGWEATTTLYDGLQKTVAWYLEQTSP